MNVHGLSEVELDLLADFTAGVLDADQNDRVARLIATDDRWAIAHDALVDADLAVRSDLRAIAGPIEMPPDVSARLDETIAGLAEHPHRAALRPVPTQAQHPHARPAPVRHAARPAGWRRVGLTVVGVAAAAIVLVLGVTVVANLQHTQLGTNSASAPGNQSDARGPEVWALPGGPPTTHSGRNYQPGTLGQLAPGQREAPQAAAPAPTGAPPPAAGGAASKAATSSNDSALQAPAGPLDRLTNPDALRACLAAIDLVHAGTPSLVDFAEFQGTPALVVVVQEPNRVVAVVVGAACGQGSANELYSAPIGP